MSVDGILKWLHLTANIVWIGAILSVALVLLLEKPEPKVRGEIAKTIYLRIATPGFVASFICGLVAFVMDVGNYGKAPWMHIKLTLALGVIGLHHVIGGRAKKMADGDAKDAGPTKILLIVTLVLVVGIAFLVKFKVPGG